MIGKSTYLQPNLHPENINQTHTPAQNNNKREANIKNFIQNWEYNANSISHTYSSRSGGGGRRQEKLASNKAIV